MVLQIGNHFSDIDVIRRINFLLPLYCIDYDFCKDEVLYIILKETAARKLFNLVTVDNNYDAFVKIYGYNNDLDLVSFLFKLGIKKWYFNVKTKGLFLGESDIDDIKDIKYFPHSYQII